MDEIEEEKEMHKRVEKQRAEIRQEKLVKVRNEEVEQKELLDSRLK